MCPARFYDLSFVNEIVRKYLFTIDLLLMLYVRGCYFLRNQSCCKCDRDYCLESAPSPS